MCVYVRVCVSACSRARVCMCVIYMVYDHGVCGCVCVCVCRDVGTLIRIRAGAKGSIDEAFCSAIC